MKDLPEKGYNPDATWVTLPGFARPTYSIVSLCYAIIGLRIPSSAKVLTSK